MNKDSQPILVLGSARSGKSTFAQQLGQRYKRSVAFIARATASDEDIYYLCNMLLVTPNVYYL